MPRFGRRVNAKFMVKSNRLRMEVDERPLDVKEVKKKAYPKV